MKVIKAIVAIILLVAVVLAVVFSITGCAVADPNAISNPASMNNNYMIETQNLGDVTITYYRRDGYTGYGLVKTEDNNAICYSIFGNGTACIAK